MTLLIVIPALNKESGIKNILNDRSMPEIHHRNSPVTQVEIRLVSDGSTDRTVELASRYVDSVRLIVFKRSALLMFSVALLSRRIVQITVGAKAGLRASSGWLYKAFLSPLYWLALRLLIVYRIALVVPNLLAHALGGAPYEHWSRFIAISFFWLVPSFFDFRARCCLLLGSDC